MIGLGNCILRKGGGFCSRGVCLVICRMVGMGLRGVLGGRIRKKACRKSILPIKRNSTKRKRPVKLGTIKYKGPLPAK